MLNFKSKEVSPVLLTESISIWREGRVTTCSFLHDEKVITARIRYKTDLNFTDLYSNVNGGCHPYTKIKKYFLFVKTTVRRRIAVAAV
jgi:hypothetical protein